MTRERTSLIYTVLKALAISMGAGATSLGLYHNLKTPDSLFRGALLDQVTKTIGYAEIRGQQEAIEHFLIQIHGPWRSPSLAADIIAQPGSEWNSKSLSQTTLSKQLDPSLLVNAFDLAVRPADVQKLPGIYVVKEYGEPINAFNIATVRYFLAGRFYLPSSVLPARDAYR